MGDLPAAVHQGYLGLVPFFKETADMLYLEVKVVVIGLGPDLDLFYLDMNLFLLCLLLFLAHLVLVFAEIHDTAYRRRGRGRNLHKIQLTGFRCLKGLADGQYSQLFAIVGNDSYLIGTNSLVDVDRCSFGSSYGGTS